MPCSAVNPQPPWVATTSQSKKALKLLIIMIMLNPNSPNALTIQNVSESTSFLMFSKALKVKKKPKISPYIV